MNRTNTVCLLATAAAFLTTNAQAQFPPAPETRIVTIKVELGDLDLDKPADARVLYSRFEKAAKQACGPRVLAPSRYDVTPTAIDHDYKACIARAMGDVVARLSAPLVTRVHAESRQKKSGDVAKR